MDDPVVAMARKRMELRVTYMDALRAKGDEDALAQVALSVGELSAWLDDAVNEGDDDHRRASALLAVRHLRAMPSRRREREEAMQLSLGLLHRLVTSNAAAQMAAGVAIMLHDNDLHSLVGALVNRYGSADRDGDVRVWRCLLVVRHIIMNCPKNTEFDAPLYHHFPVHDKMEQLRLADIINSGLTSPIPACRMEAIRVLRALAVIVGLSTAEKIVEILLDAVDDEVCDEGAQFIVANVWEVLFFRPQLMRRDFSSLCLTAPKALIRQVAIHGALRHITFAQFVGDFEVALLCFIVELYASGHEKDTLCLELMYSFFEESLGCEPSHHLLVQRAVIHMNREAYLTGVPLPSSRLIATGASQQSQQGDARSHAQLRRQNRLLTSSLKTTDLNDLIRTMQQMLREEFSTTYTRDRLISILGVSETHN